MPSIAKAQQKALQSGFLNNLGSGRTGAPRLSTVEAMLALYAEEFIKAANDNLNKDNSVSTGKLGDSIEFEIESFGTAYKMQILVLDYYDYVNKGVKGVKGSGISSPYSFKYINPSKSHIEAIRKWIKENRDKVKVTDIKYGKTRQESKAIPYDKKVSQLAYIIARSNKKKGIKGTGFWDKAFTETFNDFAVQMSKALGVDVQVDLNQLVQGMKKKR